MKVSVEIVTGGLFYIEVLNSAIVRDVKKKIESEENWKADSIILILKEEEEEHGMKQMILEDDEKLLVEYGVKNGSHIYLFFNNLPHCQEFEFSDDYFSTHV